MKFDIKNLNDYDWACNEARRGYESVLKFYKAALLEIRKKCQHPKDKLRYNQGIDSYDTYYECSLCGKIL
ncbi:MAG: hypothetical protein AABY22_12805 [Nanoarchaeota archaeon]